MNRLRLQILSILFLLLFSEGCKKSDSGTPVPPVTPTAAPAALCSGCCPCCATTSILCSAEDRDVRISQEQSDQ